jgi:hypothetical protein
VKKKEIKTKVFTVDLQKEIVKEVYEDKLETYGLKFKTKNTALSYLLTKLLEQYLINFKNGDVSKQLDKLTYIINEIRGQI